MSNRRALLALCTSLSAAVVLTHALAEGPQPPPARPSEPAKAEPVAQKREVKKAQATPEAKRAAAKRELDAITEQLTENIRGFLISELAFARSACDLTTEQRRRIARDAGELLEKMTGEFTPLELRHSREGLVPPGFPDPAQRIGSGFAALVQAHVSRAQWGRYQEENRKRMAHRQRVVLRAIVAKLDRRLVLTTAQRDQIASSLAAHWNKDWERWLQRLLNEESLPKIPDRFIAPFLSESQKKVWNEPKNSRDDPWEGFRFAGQIANIVPPDVSIELVKKSREAQPVP